MSTTEFNLLGKVMLELIDAIFSLETLLQGDVGANAGD